MFLAMLFQSRGCLHVYVNTGSPCPWNEIASSAEPLRGLKVYPRRHPSLLKGEKTASSSASDPFLPPPFYLQSIKGRTLLLQATHLVFPFEYSFFS